MRARDFFGGMLLGALIGATVSLLLTPQSGEETREMIADKWSDLSEKAKESSRQMMESGRDLLEQGKSQMNEMKEKVAQTVKQAKDQAKADQA